MCFWFAACKIKTNKLISFWRTTIRAFIRGASFCGWNSNRGRNYTIRLTFLQPTDLWWVDDDIQNKRVRLYLWVHGHGRWPHAITMLYGILVPIQKCTYGFFKARPDLKISVKRHSNNRSICLIQRNQL